MDMRRKISILETWAQCYYDRYSATEKWLENKLFPVVRSKKTKQKTNKPKN